MATVQLKVGKSSSLTRLSNQENVISLWRRPRQVSVTVLNRLWWTTKAYGIVLGIMQLVLVSLFLIYLNWLSHKLLPIKRIKKELSMGGEPPATT
jgi:hypothetical protein